MKTADVCVYLNYCLCMYIYSMDYIPRRNRDAHPNNIPCKWIQICEELCEGNKKLWLLASSQCLVIEPPIKLKHMDTNKLLSKKRPTHSWPQFKSETSRGKCQNNETHKTEHIGSVSVLKFISIHKYSI